MTTPVLVSAVIDGYFLTLTYDNLLDEAFQPSACYFQVSINDSNRTIDSLTIDGNTVILTLTARVSAGDTAKLSYIDPSVGNDAYAIQSLTGEDATSLINYIVSNITTPPAIDATAPRLVSASFTEAPDSVITLIHNEALQFGSGSEPVLLKNGATPINYTASITGATITLTTDATLSANDFVVLSYDGLGLIRDTAGNFLAPVTLVIGGSGGNSIDASGFYPDYFPLTIRANGGGDNIIGSEWNDAINAGGGQDTINGFWGADNISLGETTRQSDTVVIAIKGEADSGSIVREWDTVFQYDVTGTTTNDKLSLASNEIAADVAHADGIDFGGLSKHSITSGILSFEDSNGDAVLINKSNFNDALGYLSQNLTDPGKAVGFGRDNDGNGYTDTLFVFQNTWGDDPAEYDHNTLVQLKGLNGVTLGTSAGQNVVQLIDTHGPSPTHVSTTASGVSVSFNETVASVDFSGLLLQKGTGSTLTAMVPVGAPGISANVVSLTTSTAVASTDYVLISISDYLQQSATDNSGNTAYLFDSSWPGLAVGGAGDTVIDLSGLSGNYGLFDLDGGNDKLIGNSSDNDMVGGLGNDTLNGGMGADLMEGGLGNDTYVVDNVGDVVSELAAQGIDLVQSSITYSLMYDVENLTLTGTSAINGNGNSLNNVLTGNVAANSFYGLGGADTLNGNGGNDNLNGGDGDDRLNGGAGNDNLAGDLGADTLVGGLGDDIYVVDVAGDVVTELLNAGIDTVISTVTRTLGANQENLVLSGDQAINGTGNILDNGLTGNAAANILSGLVGADMLNGGGGNDTLNGGDGNDALYGGEGNDILNGGAGVDFLDGGIGADTMRGNLGNDTYVVDNTGDIVTELGGQGIDIVQSGITYTLTAKVEKLTLTGTLAINGTGNVMNNTLLGNSMANKLSGLGGADNLNGGDGNDTLIGGAGNDVLTGGLGNDFFVFNTVLNPSTNIDTLKDYTAASDTIRLENAIFTSLTAVGVLNASSFVVGTTALDANDYLIYDNGSGALYYDGDGSGSGAAVQFASVYSAGTTPAALSAAEFVVI